MNETPATWNAMVLMLTMSGISMIAHVILSQVLRVLVRWESALTVELFAVPNAPLVPDSGFFLLNAKYFLPWTASPVAMTRQAFVTRFIFMAARITGAGVPALWLAFLATAVLMGTH